ncbi:HAD family hydrolase [Planctomicrobium sp. SH664]|uniref:HAD family hydrolase n=1 Tax=Planctomicrobium sp. SH664 TaxID=3448125 RepID=UPI003F5B8980
MLKTILFDLGNVLVHFSHDRMCRQLADVCQRSPDEIRRDVFESNLHLEFERGQLTEEEFADRLRSLYGVPFSLERLQWAAGDIFELNEPMIPVLNELKRRGLRRVLLSNTCITHVRWIEQHFDLLDRLDAKVLSYEVGAAKPEPEIYLAALDQIHCDPQECLYVDDIAPYVAAGKSFGLHAEVFTSAQRFCDDLLRYDIRLPLAKDGES